MSPCLQFTTKHHEGFSMFATNTKVHNCWDWSATSAFEGIVPCNKSADGIAFSSMSMFGRDLTAEIVAAARRAGIAPGLYFSHIDWFDADMRIDGACHVASACPPKR